MGAPETYGSGTVPWTSDTQRMLLVKLIIAEAGGGGSGVQQVFPNHYGGSPPNPPNPTAFTPPADYAVAPDLDAPFQQFVWNPDTQLWT